MSSPLPTRRSARAGRCIRPSAAYHAAALAAALLPGALGAQTATGNVRGYVTGTGGAPVGDAQVVATYAETNARRSTTTNAAGFYYLGALRPGRYTVSVRRVGFAPQTRAVTVGIGETSDLNVATAESAVQLSAVQVTANAAAAQTTRTSEVGGSISRQQIANLPNFERNVLDLAKLVPGVNLTSTDVNSTDKTFAAGGQPASAVNIFIDGATYKSDVLPGGTAGQRDSKGNPFPQGAIQEFRVLTQNYKAEYQRASSAIILATTRSGTNQTVADAFFNNIGYGFSAKDAYAERQGLGAPQYRRLQVGGNLGGPIVRDKLFYFLDYEGNFRDDPAYITLGGNAANAPAPLLSQLQGLLGQQQQTFREHLGVAKLSYVQSERSTIDASVNIRHDRDFRDFGGRNAYAFATNLPNQVYTGTFNWKYAGDRFVNEAQFTPQQYLYQQVPVNPTLIGQNYDGLLRTGGNGGGQQFTQNRFSFRDDLTRSGVQLAGDHVFKFGANLDLLGYRATKNFSQNPQFTYFAANNYAHPLAVVFGGGDPTIRTTNKQFGAYAQDDWTLGRRLTLNLGLRWDSETNPINNSYVTPRSLADSLRGPLNKLLYRVRPLPSGGGDTLRVIDQLGGLNRFLSNGRSSRPLFLKAFQPRLGFSYDASARGDNTTVLFGGGGLYYDRQNWNTFYDEQWRRQYGQYRVAFPDTACTPGVVGCAAWNPQYLANPATLRQLVGTTALPEVFLVADNLRPPRTTQASFGVRQALGGTQLTVSYNGVFGKNITNYVAAAPYGSLGPNYSNLFVTDDRVKTRYNALQLQVQRPLFARSRFGGGLAYTLSKSQQQGNSDDIFWGFDDRYPTVADRPWLIAPGDQRHKIVANGTARLPGEFLLSSIVTLASPVTVSATNSSGGTGTYQQFTYPYVGPGGKFLGIGHVFATRTADLRLEKDLPLRGGQRVAVVLDGFNVFNTANLGCYNGDIPAPGAANALYGQPTCAGPGRRFQFGLRYGLHPDFGSGTSKAATATGDASR